MLIIDQEKCKRDRICANECPLKIIEFKDKASYPTPGDQFEAACIKCGHCVSVCPHEALVLRDIEVEDCLPVNQNLLPSPDQIELFMKSRRSIRKFKKQSVEREKLERIIDIARYAPTGHNTQSVHWLVIEDRNEVHELAGYVADWMRFMITNAPEAAASMHMPEIVAGWEEGIDRICRDAPHLVLAYGPENVGATPASCTIALTYLELAAYALGLGACWAGYLGAAAGYFPPLVKKLDLPAGYKVYGAMMVGYPQYTYHRIPPRQEARIVWR